MFKSRVILLFLFFLQLGFAQHVEIQISGSPSTNASLLELSGETTILKDTIRTKEAGIFSFSLKKSYAHTGFYRLIFESNKWVDFLYDGRDISIKTNGNNIADSLHVATSESNKIYYAFVKLNKQYKAKSEILQLVLVRYPKEDNFYQTTQIKLLQLQQEYADFIETSAQNNPRSFIAQYVTSAQLPIIDITIPPEKQLEYLKTHALDKINFNEVDLIKSDVFVSKAIEYLTYYRNPQLTKELLEKEFMVAVDSILNKARVNQMVYGHLVDYLINGFKKFGFDKILDYIVENYVIKDDLCLDVKTEGMIKRRIDQARILKIGAVAPNFVLPDSTGKNYDLSKAHAQKTLVIFYASWCPHCQTMLPQISEFQKTNKSFDVVAISMDTKREDWINFIKNNNLNWNNLSDLKGWDGAVTNEYLIYATPTMFLLDSMKKIIAKPLTFEEAKAVL